MHENKGQPKRASRRDGAPNFQQLQSPGRRSCARCEGPPQLHAGRGKAAAERPHSKGATASSPRGRPVTTPGFSPTGIRFENIDKRYGGLYALRHVSLEIPAGECVAFAGRNGSGKTTLLRIAARLARPSSGAVNFLNGSGEKFATPPPAGFVAP